mmetsp:Transcript_894/g.2253  ORF Transcript_894/g.2253 Transcript_894/m.2253 type:complete len:109 (+) Transcript_894:1287-1613(+)
MLHQHRGLFDRQASTSPRNVANPNANELHTLINGFDSRMKFVGGCIRVPPCVTPAPDKILPFLPLAKNIQTKQTDKARLQCDCSNILLLLLSIKRTTKQNGSEIDKQQ